jgi:hypothetical protein
MSEEQTGVDNASAAGEQSGELDLDNYFSGEDETGVEDPSAAGQETGEEGEAETVEGEAQPDEAAGQDFAKDFAKKLAAEREKIRRELEEEYQAAQAPAPVQQPGGILPAPPVLTRDVVSQLAAELGTSEEVVRVMYNLQHTVNQYGEMFKGMAGYIVNLEDTSTKGQAMAEIEKMRVANPLLPEFDEARISRIRADHKKAGGGILPWKKAYEQLVSEEAISGNLLRQVEHKTEQKTVQQITKRGSKTTQVGKGGGQAKRPGIEDLSAEDFNKLVEKAKAGQYKKS